jgi:hypothetical protein
MWIVLYNLPEPLKSQYAVGLPDSQIIETIRIGTKVNEKILPFGEGLDFFYQQEYRKRTIKADYDMHLTQIWNSLKSRYVDEGWTLSPPSPLFVQFDSHTIKQAEIHKINLWSNTFYSQKWQKLIMFPLSSTFSIPPERVRGLRSHPWCDN